MTPSQIETAARRRLNAVSDTFWSSDEVIENYLYHACLEMARETRVIESSTTTSAVASQQAYAYPTGVAEIKRITHDGKPLALIDMQKADMLGNATGTTQTGTPTNYWIWGQYINLFPAPASSGSSNIKIWYYGEPAAVTSSSTLEIPSVYHDYLVTGTVFYMVCKEPSDPRIPLFRKEWDEALAKVRMHVQRKKRAAGFNRVNVEDQLYNVY